MLITRKIISNTTEKEYPPIYLEDGEIQTSSNKMYKQNKLQLKVFGASLKNFKY